MFTILFVFFGHFFACALWSDIVWIEFIIQAKIIHTERNENFGFFPFLIAAIQSGFEVSIPMQQFCGRICFN